MVPGVRKKRRVNGDYSVTGMFFEWLWSLLPWSATERRRRRS